MEGGLPWAADWGQSSNTKSPSTSFCTKPLGLYFLFHVQLARARMEGVWGNIWSINATFKRKEEEEVKRNICVVVPAMSWETGAIQITGPRDSKSEVKIKLKILTSVWWLLWSSVEADDRWWNHRPTAKESKFKLAFSSGIQNSVSCVMRPAQINFILMP